jgi:hypothetical protein
VDVASLIRLLLTLALATLASSALAATPLEEVQLAELDRLRAKIADEVHLAAYDLIDELIVQWTQEPVFDKETPVVLASVSVPVGLGTGMAALVENHIGAVLGDNPSTNMQLVHCPACTAVVVHSGPEGTVVSRGYDNPKALAELGNATGKHALFVDIEAEGAWLVLRARITRLTADLPIVWSHTLASSASTPTLLRESTHLKSAADARQEYIDALHDRGPILVPIRLTIRSYARPFGGVGTPPPPFPWLQSGVELGTTNARAWTSSLLVGYSFIPQAYQGIMGQARVSRLITGRARSLTHPDLYLFVGAAAISVWGPATAPFQQERITADEILAAADEEGPRNSFGGLHIGLDLRVGNRIGFSAFLEGLPSLARSPNLGTYRLVGIPFQSLGTEVTLCF